MQKHLIVGALLASVVVFLFMGNLRATLIAAVAIPCSVIATFAFMKVMGFTLNWLTLLALTLSVGIVIDDAIVVLENIFRFIEEKNMSPFEAARAATAEVGLAVSATTLSLVVIFVPVAFIPGVMGSFLKSFGLDHGRRDHGVVAGRVHADTDAVVALPAPRAGKGAVTRSLVLSPDRSRLHRRAARRDAPPLAGGAGGLPDDGGDPTDRALRRHRASSRKTIAATSR